MENRMRTSIVRTQASMHTSIEQARGARAQARHTQKQLCVPHSSARSVLAERSVDKSAGLPGPMPMLAVAAEDAFTETPGERLKPRHEEHCEGMLNRHA
jgi:hypothetical protein